MTAKELYEACRMAIDEDVDRAKTLLESLFLLIRTSESETKPSRDADHCDYPDCEQHYRSIVERQREALAAADVLAHQSIYTPFHERYWQARGGHNACTVCNPDSESETLPPLDRRAIASAVLMIAEDWVKHFQPSCAESLLQVDSVNQALPELAEALCDVVGYFTMKTATDVMLDQLCASSKTGVHVRAPNGVCVFCGGPP